MHVDPGEVTELLRRMRAGQKEAASKLLPLVYNDLRRLAAARLRRERRSHTLQPTALVHEVFLRLVGGHNVDWRNRAHFFAVAAGIIRHILVDHARDSKSLKRGGSLQRVELDEAFQYAEERSSELVALDEALDRLAEFSPRQSQMVEMRFFGGLNEEEIASVQGISARTVKRDWRIARAWLHTHLSL
jgi:RNA polymerase sigma factor (TIGR02999 family)